MQQDIYVQDNSTSSIYYIKTTSDLSTVQEVVLTEYPTTEGTPISDHAYRSPTEISWSIALSDISSQINMYSISGTNARQYITVDQAKVLFNGWLNNAVRLNIQTRNNLFRNMVLTSLTLTETNKGLWKPDMTFTEVRIAKLSLAVYDKTANTIVKVDENWTVYGGELKGTILGDSYEVVIEKQADAISNMITAFYADKRPDHKKAIAIEVSMQEFKEKYGQTAYDDVQIEIKKKQDKLLEEEVQRLKEAFGIKIKGK